jgi:hypothetical protein
VGGSGGGPAEVSVPGEFGHRIGKTERTPVILVIERRPGLPELRAGLLLRREGFGRHATGGAQDRQKKDYKYGSRVDKSHI